MLLAFMHNGYLVETGWLQNLNTKNPVDINRNPIPWTTYSFIYFIREYLKPEMELFEFGSGNSTLFFAARIKHIYTVEHDPTWYNKTKAELPENSAIFLKDLNDENCILDLKKKIDLIFIDGRRRNKCLIVSAQCLKDEGIIVLDHSERIEYKEGIDFLLSQGFKKIEFWGISHRYFHNKATTVFLKNYKLESCLK